MPDNLFLEFLAAEKIARHALRWRTLDQRDYVRASATIVAPSRRAFVGKLQVQAHKLRDPTKVSFSLLFRGVRLLGLDVEPARFHRNLLRGSVSATHWQTWPTMDAEPDMRKLLYSQWLREFLARAKIEYNFRINPPPRGDQLGFNF